jgi:Tfp pilus assembly protein PilF
MVHGRRKLVFCWFIFFLVPVLRAQQGGIGNLVGEIHLGRGDFPGKILVELQLRGATLASAYCDDEGKFGFGGLSSNPYHIVIQDEHFYPIDQLAILDTSISTLLIVQVSLNPRVATKNDSPPDHDHSSNPYLVDTSEYRRRFPKKAVKEFDEGVKAEKNRKHDDAVLHYQNSIVLAPDFYLAHNNLGLVYLTESLFSEAQSQFEQVIKISPNDAMGYLNLGNAMLLRQQYVTAVHWVGEGLTRQPNSSFGHFLMGTLFSRLGKLEVSEKELKRSLELDPLMANAHLALVNLYIQQKRTRDAATELRTFLATFPDDSMAPKARQVLIKLEEGATKDARQH